MCFILEEYLKCELQLECWRKDILMQSVALMLLILIPDLLLRSTLAVSYCLPLRTFSAPLLSHTNTFSGLESATKFSQANPKKPRPPQHSLLHSFCLRSLNQRCSCRTAVRVSAYFYRAPAAHRSHTSTSRLWLSSVMENVTGYGTSSVTVPAWKWLRWAEMQQVYLCEFSLWRTTHEKPAKSPVHPLMTRYDQERHGHVRRYHGDKHRQTLLHSFCFFTNFYLANVIKILFQFRLLFTEHNRP